MFIEAMAVPQLDGFFVMCFDAIDNVWHYQNPDPL
jgi:hypothetical protein